MRIGVHVPNCMEGLIVRPPFAPARANQDLAVQAESLGYASVWVNDHITTQRYLSHLNPKPNYYDPIVTMAAIAAVTSRVRIGTGILVVPIRHPVIAAKQIATLDDLSGGRIVIAVGAGAYKEEFEAVHPGLPTRARGRIITESVTAMQALFTQEKASFAGEYIRFGEIELNPKPVQQPFPLWMGGNGDAVLRRAGRLGEGWFPAALTPAEFGAKWEIIAGHAREAGRDPGALDHTLELLISIDTDRERAIDRFKRSLSYEHLLSLSEATLKGQDIERTIMSRNLLGGPEDIVAQLKAYEQAGVRDTVLIFTVDTLREMEESMELFARTVMPHFAD